MENNTITAEAEETNETAAQGAIDVSENTGIVKWEDTVKNAIPAIPPTLTINGLEVNNDKLKETIEKEVKTMKINGLGDKEGFDKAEAKLKELSKLRTGSNTWRTNVMKPVIAFQKSLKGSIDKTGELCTEGETYLESILLPIRNAIEIARQEEETRKDALAEVRSEEIIAMGGVFDGKGTYKFEYDGGIFILASQLRSLNDEEYLKETQEIRDSWATEQTRLQAIEDEKNAEQKKLLSQLEDLNSERTDFRKEQLEMKGFDYAEDSDAYYFGAAQITTEQLLNANKDEWKALMNPVAPVAEVATATPVAETAKEEVKPVSTGGGGSFHAPAPPAPNEFAVEEETKTEEPAATPAPVAEVVTAVDVPKALTRSMVFSEAKPFITLDIPAKFNLRVYPHEYTSLSQSGLPEGALRFTGDIDDKLRFSVVMKAE